MIEHIPNHTALAKEDLLTYRHKPRMLAFLAACMSEAQYLENKVFGLYISQTLNHAREDVLRQLGEAVGEEQGALSEDEYRQVISARILARRRPRGLAPRDHMIRVFGLLTAPSTVQFWYRHPMGIRMAARRGRGMSEAMHRRIRRLMDDVYGSGYALDLVEVVEGQFTLNTEDGFGTPMARAF
jgi:hypothetical protein